MSGSPDVAVERPTLALLRPRLKWLALWPLLPALIFLCGWYLFPLIQLLGLSFVDRDGALSSINYTRLVSTTTYMIVLGTTFKVATYTTLVCLAAGYPLAYALATATEKTRGSLFFLVLIPFWTSFLVRTFAWIVLLGRYGALNRWLVDAGIVEAPLPLIYNMAGVLIGMVHALMPLAVVTMLSVMQAIDPNLPKAAATLGARGGQAFWRVYFPLSLPGVAAAGLLVFITSLGFFITPALLGSGQDVMISQIVIEQIVQLLNWGFAGAVGLLLLLATLLVFFFYDQIFGLSTLAAGATGDGGPHTYLRRMGSRSGHILIAILGGLSDRCGEALDLLRPLRATRPRLQISRFVLWATASAVIVYLVVPALFVIPVSFTQGTFIEWPPRGFSLDWYRQFFLSPVWIGATVRSFVIGLTAATLAMALGVPAAFVLSRQRILGRTAMLAFILSPMIVPRILFAVSLFYLYARLGLVGTSLGLVLGHTVVALPYVVICVMAVLKTYDVRLDQAARILGASNIRAFWHVTLPLIRPGLIAAFLFAFVTSFDELTIALFVTGGITTTLPKQMWDDAILNIRPTVTAASTITLLIITIMILFAEYFRRRSARARA